MARGDFDWQVVYDDDEAVDLVTDLLMAISGRFDDMPKRINWFINVVDSNLGPPTPGGADATWHFDEAEFHILFAAMFEDLRAILDTDNGEASISARHGPRAVRNLRDFIRHLDGRRRELST